MENEEKPLQEGHGLIGGFGFKVVHKDGTVEYGGYLKDDNNKKEVHDGNQNR